MSNFRASCFCDCSQGCAGFFVSKMVLEATSTFFILREGGM